jgi:leader peptidase (prepilin peptidase)/N-methyltransferase
MVWYWLVLLFGVGACLGSFLNVCIYRIPLEKSILWPGSRCGHCLQPIRWYDNIPLLSYWLLRGRCRSCGSRFSMRYFLIELLTGLSFAGLFYLEVVENIHQFPALQDMRAHLDKGLLPPGVAWIVWGHHALLVCFLIVASFCDLDHREIPLSITIPGALLGLAGAVLWPWPWPHAAGQVALPVQPWWLAAGGQTLPTGLYPWPVWGPLPDWLPPGSWQLGLATGLAGLIVGTLMLRVIRFLFGLGLGIEALGLGDADLMMMAGSFLGWQPVVVAFFLGVFLGLFFGVFQVIFRGDNAMAFGPALSLALVGTFLGWRWIGPEVQSLLFNDLLLVILGVIGCVLMLAASYLLRLLRLMRPAPPEGPDGPKAV